MLSGNTQMLQVLSFLCLLPFPVPYAEVVLKMSFLHILPCPFCGSEGEDLVIYLESETATPYMPEARSPPISNNCGAHMDFSGFTWSEGNKDQDLVAVP